MKEERDMREALAAMDAEIKDEAKAAVDYALAADYPPEEEVDAHVFSGVAHARPYLSGDAA